MITGILNGISQLGGQWLENSRQKSVAKTQVKITEIEKDAEFIKGNMTTDEIQVRANAKSSFDEWLTAFLLIPLAITMAEGLVAVWTAQSSAPMWRVFESIPIWYQAGMGMVLAGRFGLRGMALRFFGKGKPTKK